MNYLVEMRLVRIKPQAEIDQEIKDGIYKGDSHVYESIFKDGEDRILGKISQMGSSLMEKNAIERIIKNAVAKIDNKPLDEIELGKVNLKDITDSSFPIIARTYDFMSQKVAKQHAEIRAQNFAPTINEIEAEPKKHINLEINPITKIDEVAKNEQFSNDAAIITNSIAETIQAVRKSVADQFGLIGRRNLQHKSNL